jgi:4-hydroxythreonine-4-phosphate dehydrogenase
VNRGVADAIVFAPLNKHSLHEAGMRTSDELHWFVDQFGFEGPVCEFNVLDDLWTSRVTSHIPHRDVADQITVEGVTRGIELIHRELLRSGVASPRIAVCGLNPHNGDNGSFGREEIDIIRPAVDAVRGRGILAEGPFAADTIFLKVQGEQRQYDAVVTMYHDQGQIAMKLMGFWRGITVQGGLPFPILTPAHGTAFDIAGQGVANPGAMVQAFDLACRMALARRAQEPGDALA